MRLSPARPAHQQLAAIAASFFCLLSSPSSLSLNVGPCPCRSDAEKQFRMTFLELSSEGDKQLAFANTTALRTVVTEKCLWLKDR